MQCSLSRTCLRSAGFTQWETSKNYKVHSVGDDQGGMVHSVGDVRGVQISLSGRHLRSAGCNQWKMLENDAGFSLWSYIPEYCRVESVGALEDRDDAVGNAEEKCKLQSVGGDATGVGHT